jgi:acetyltransferase-like isoleucine patch superfamily enzyme
VFLEICPPIVRKLIFKLGLAGFGKNSYIDYRYYIRYMRQLSIGNFVTVNRGCKFFFSHFHNDAKIIIGNHVAIAPDCAFHSATHDYTAIDLPNTAGSITMGNDVWVGANSMILGKPEGRVTIGDGAVIAAGSIVTRDVPPFTIVAGVPARVVKKRYISDNEVRT